MSEEEIARELAKKEFVAIFYERVNPETVFDLIIHLNDALNKFGKPFSPIELGMACQYLINFHFDMARIYRSEKKEAG
jgi:hypothetical protein